MTVTEALDEVRSCRKQGTSGDWRLGVVYNYIIDHDLAKEQGHQTAQQLLGVEFKDLLPSKLSLCGRIAGAFTEDDTLTHGLSMLGRLLTYRQATQDGPIVGDPGAVPVVIPRKDGTTVEKRFADCTREELGKAIGRHRAPPREIPPQDAELVSRLTSAIQTMGVSMELKAIYGGGKTFLTFSRLDIVKLWEVLEGLLATRRTPPAAALARALPARAARTAPKRRAARGTTR